MTQLSVNGIQRSFDGDPDMPVLWYLRDILGLTGTKFGCGAGLRGVCTVHRNGDAIRMCCSRSRCSRRGNHNHRRHGPKGSTPSSKSLDGVECSAMRVLPGWTNHASDFLLRQKPKPADHDIDELMSGNICRCGTYRRIRAAIKLAAFAGEIK